MNRRQLKDSIIEMDGSGESYLTILDEEGNILQVNARMQKKLNLKKPMQEKTNFFDLLHPVHIESFKNAFRYSLKNKDPYPVNLFLKNGVYQHMKWQVKYLPSASNIGNSFICLGTPVTEEVAHVQQTPVWQSNNEIFNVFMNNSSNLFWAVDEAATLVFANKAFYSYFRLDEKALNKKILEILPLVVTDVLYDKHLKVFRTALPIDIEEKGKSADGNSIPFQVKLFPFNDTFGNKLVGGIAIDYSERNNIEKKLEAAQERIVQLHHITSDAIWEWDMMSGKISRNEKLAEMTGFLADNLKGLSWWLTRVHPKDRDGLTNKLKEVTDKSLQSWESEYRFLCADGEYIYVLDRGYVIYSNGMPLKMIGSINDISNVKLMENLLLEEKMQHFKKISETAMRVQEQERSRIGRELHDNVNQILSTIRLFVGMLTPADKEEKVYKEKAVEYTQLAIEEIRKLSRELVVPQLDGETLIDHISTIIVDIELTTGLKIKFTHDFDSELLSPGKKITLFRIIQEQLKNILKYSKADQIEICLQSRQEYVELAIKDNGVGFDLKSTNSGIGLANIKDRVNFYNGKTEIVSGSGQGCQVTVRIPLLD